MSKSYIISMVITLLLASCKKELISTSVKVPPVLIDKRPVAIAGSDTTIVLPINSLKLDGTASYDSDGTIKSYQWRIIKFNLQNSIPGTINNADKAEAIATGLSGGWIYNFELLVTDNDGSWARDTITVKVERIIPDETSHIFTGLQNGDYNSCGIKVKNFDSFIPPNTSYRIYLRSTFYTTDTWFLVDNTSSQIFYEIVNSELTINLKNIDCNFDPLTYDILIDWD